MNIPILLAEIHKKRLAKTQRIGYTKGHTKK